MSTTDIVVKLLIAILPALIIAAIVCLSWRAKMKTARIARTADNYIPAGGFKLTGQTDQFLYRTKTERKINTGSSSPGGAPGK